MGDIEDAASVLRKAVSESSLAVELRGVMLWLILRCYTVLNVRLSVLKIHDKAGIVFRVKYRCRINKINPTVQLVRMNSPPDNEPILRSVKGESPLFGFLVAIWKNQKAKLWMSYMRMFGVNMA